ncbi:hypothetical protein DFO67_1179 [Modicisalibacter xianhensis]|uniref:Uncharacterized protein n=1 Tax=Modicisalibacter xianhensis TaxID=442341 RepID=A0A4R8FRQ7_9GAMM|nr:hypothetical protein DFO67_1179 [Halomonas xianhensis]
MLPNSCRSILDEAALNRLVMSNRQECGQPTGMILLGVAPYTAMVFTWASSPRGISTNYTPLVQRPHTEARSPWMSRRWGATCLTSRSFASNLYQLMHGSSLPGYFCGRLVYYLASWKGKAVYKQEFCEFSLPLRQGSDCPKPLKMRFLRGMMLYLSSLAIGSIIYDSSSTGSIRKIRSQP